jgi:type VI secretion system protein ImpK
MSTLLEKTYWACSEPLGLAAQLGGARDLPPPDVLQRRIEGLLDQMARKAEEAGLSGPDIDAIKYAIIAFIDEQILRSEWPGRMQWLARPMQLTHFGENTAGEGFFTRMEQLRQEPARSHVLEIYFLCVALGFQGVYAVRSDDGTLSAISERASSQLLRGLPNPEVFSPHGDPRDARRGYARPDAPIIALGILSLVAATVLFVVLRVLVGSSASAAAAEMNRLPVASSGSAKTTGKTTP